MKSRIVIAAEKPRYPAGVVASASSIGLESADDLIRDLDEALAVADR